MSTQPRVLLVGHSPTDHQPVVACGDVTRVGSLPAGLELLERDHFDALLADLSDAGIVAKLRAGQWSEELLGHLADGVAVVDFDLRVCYANPAFERWCGANPVGKGVYEALGATRQDDTEFCPFHSALACRHDPARLATDRAMSCVPFQLHINANRHLEMHVTLLEEEPNPLFVVLCHDSTALVQKQQKLDALYRAGRELTALDPVVLAELSVSGRIELLKGNIRRLIHDLLHYETIEIRLLDQETGKLQPLLQDGIEDNPATLNLFARPQGNGVTGFVAATGQSYLCPDTQADPLYLPGAAGARSSLTVPLRLHDRVIGTFNVESTRPGAFGREDLQFAEIFSHAVAAALGALELLSVEKKVGASQSIEAVNREVALPVDDILADATFLLERYVGHAPEVAERIRKILANARQIKQSILQVGEDLAPRPLPSAIREPVVFLRGLRVLVADNDDRVRRSAHQLIGRWGGIVETARDGQEALTMARLAQYDAILADIRLPDLAGYEVYRALRQAQPAAAVILMTGYGYDAGHAIVRARQEGLKQVLFKPFRVDQLRDALARVRKENG